MKWPNDADGDVFRRLDESGFDFTKIVDVDYNVDFAVWPPPSEALDSLGRLYGALTIVEPEGGLPGYVQFQVRGLLTYETVTSTQADVTRLMAVHHGVCESWGVFE